MQKFLFLLLASCSYLVGEVSPPPPPPAPVESAPVQKPDHDDDIQPEAIKEWDASGYYKTAFFRTVFLIVGVIALVLIVMYLLKRLATNRPLMTNHHKNIKILERRALSPQTILYQVEIGGRQVLIAESKVEVKRITEFDTLEKGKEL